MSCGKTAEALTASSYAEVLDILSNHDWAGDPRLVQQPGDGYLGRHNAQPLGHFDDALDDVPILVAVVVVSRQVVALGALAFSGGVPRALASQQSARQRTPGMTFHP